MSLWAKRSTKPLTPPAPPPAPVEQGRGHGGAYRLLHNYLRDRFADRVVLTFSEIEDLLGFALPEGARLQRDWWADTDVQARPSAQAEAWILAHRTASVNLAAQRVVFERQPEPRK